jgi:hypothetical protein
LFTAVIAGLDPAIHHFRKRLLAKGMDHPKSDFSDFGALSAQVG